MRPVSPDLLAELTRPAVIPAVAVCLGPLGVESPRWDWRRRAAESGPAGPHDAVELRGGVLLRARLTADGAIATQRLSDPLIAPVGAWTTWTVLQPAGSADPTGPLLLTSRSDQGRARLFWVEAAGQTIRWQETADGLTWSPAGTVASFAAPARVVGLAGDDRAGADLLIIGLDGGGADPDDGLWACAWTGGGWGAPVAEGVMRAGLSGLAAGAQGSGLLVLLADRGPAGEARLVLQTVGPGPAWGAPRSLRQAAPESGRIFGGLQVRPPTTAFPRYLYGFVERSEAATRPFLAVTPVADWLTEVVPLADAAPVGERVIRWSGPGEVWLRLSARRVWLSQAGLPLELSRRVWALASHLPRQRAERLDLWLDDRDGALTAERVPLGAQVSLGLGYHLPGGTVIVWQPPWWVVEREPVMGRPGRVLRLRCTGPWGWLERYRAADTVQVPGLTAGEWLQRCWWRVCGQVVSGRLHPALDRVIPDLAVLPGEDWAGLARRLCQAAGVTLRFATRSDLPDGLGLAAVEAGVVDLQAGPVAAFGAAGQPRLRRARWRRQGGRATHIVVWGAAGLADAADWESLRALGRRIAQTTVDRQVSGTAVQERAAREVLSLAPPAGWVEVLPHPGLEVGDSVAITDSLAGLSQAPFLIEAITVRYERWGPLRFVQRLDLRRPVVTGEEG
jgi:hypothetical protein